MQLIKKREDRMDFVKYIEVILTPGRLILLSLIALGVGKFGFKNRYLDCSKIIVRHLQCFKNKNKKYSWFSIFLYFVVPLLLAFSLVITRKIDDSVINIVTVIISILTSMLFTMLALILDLRKKIIKNKDYNANDANISAKI